MGNIDALRQEISSSFSSHNVGEAGRGNSSPYTGEGNTANSSHILGEAERSNNPTPCPSPILGEWRKNPPSSPHAGEVRNVIVIPMSSRHALTHFYDRKSPEWSASNIETLTGCLADKNTSPFTQAIIFRAERTLKLLDSALANKALTGSSRWRLQDYAATLRNALSASSNLADIPTMPAINHAHTSSQKSGKNLLSSLITSLREHDFRTRFFSLKAFHGERKALLLGADKAQSLKLYSRLAHNLLSEKLPEGHISRNEWLCSGNAAPFECISLPVISPGENVLIAPCDADLKNIDWPELFRHFTPVVSVDLSRIVSGLNDLSHAPYLMGLALSEWVLAFGNGGMFAHRQTEERSS